MDGPGSGVRREGFGVLAGAGDLIYLDTTFGFYEVPRLGAVQKNRPELVDSITDLARGNRAFIAAGGIEDLFSSHNLQTWTALGGLPAGRYNLITADAGTLHTVNMTDRAIYASSDDGQSWKPSVRSTESARSKERSGRHAQMAFFRARVMIGLWFQLLGMERSMQVRFLRAGCSSGRVRVFGVERAMESNGRP